MSKDKKSKSKPKFFRPDYAGIVAAVEKKFHLDVGSMSSEAKRAAFMSTGLLSTDLVLGGGILPGAWYTFYGGEGSAKSTHVMHIAQGAVAADIPIIEYSDFEGSLAPDYWEAMMTMRVKGLSFKNVFGVQNPKTGDWEVPARIKKREFSNGEEFFDPIAAVMRNLPDKKYIQGTWFYVFENTNPNRKMVGNWYSKKLFQKYGKFFVEAENGRAQAIYFTDSYPAMFPEKLDEDDKGAGLAAVARMFSENVPRVLSKLKRKGVAIIGVNQLRLRPMAQGNPEYEPAGEAVKFASSCRMKQASTVPPEGWPRDPDVYGVGKERSVLEKGYDQYRYVSVRNTKNKVSTPWLKTSQRVWVDASGQGRGFCPAYDAYNYMRMTGQIVGSRNKIAIPEFKLKGLDWDDFKKLCLLTGSDLKAHCKSLKLKEPLKLRDHCIRQVSKGKALGLMFDHMRAKKDEDEDDED
jgi:RecA/RadA recombinase